MKKIAFLVEDDFINLHVGVRNYIFSLYLSLKDFYDIDFIFESKIVIFLLRESLSVMILLYKMVFIKMLVYVVIKMIY